MLWAKFVKFLKEYFTDDITKFWNKYDPDENYSEQQYEENIRKPKKHRNSTEAQKTNTNYGFNSNLIDEGLRAIPGGRYGCAQFVKT